MKVEIILVPVDGSEGSDKAILMAKDIAEKFNSKIVLFMSVDSGLGGSMHEFYAYDPVIDEALGKRAVTILDDTAKLLEGIEVEKVQAVGRAAEQILNYMDENPVDLVIMATRGITKVSRFFMGSVTNYVVHHSKVPVLTIPVD